MPSFKNARGLNQRKGARGLGQTNTPRCGYNSFFCYTKQASVGGQSHLCVGKGAHGPTDKQIHLDVDTIVSFVILSRQVSEGRAISVSRHVN